MSKLSFDGTKLKSGSTVLANIRDVGTKICKGATSTVVATIKDDKICKGSSTSTVLFNIRKNDLCEGTGSHKIATMKDVEADIDGPGHVIKAALWLMFCR